MDRTHFHFILVFCWTSLMICEITSQRCGDDTYSIYQKMLKGHTFKSLKVRLGSLDCRQACFKDIRCQSYNVIISKSICELNNRTKEAKPEYLIKDKDRYYRQKGSERVPVGSIPELPGDSCKEIKASEGRQAASGNYWLDPTGSGKPVIARCNMTTEVADFCIKHRCKNNATCVNRKMNYTCGCNTSQWFGRYCEKDLLLGWFPGRPGNSCKHILEFGNPKGNRQYWIDPERNGNPLKLFCDMTTDGGGWLCVCNVVFDGYSNFSVETTFQGLATYPSKMCLTKNAMRELKTKMSFNQLRFHCSKRGGRIFHVSTVANSTGEAVVQYFSGETDVQPEACGSFVRMVDDNSFLVGVCSNWGKENEAYTVGKWGHGLDKDRLYNHPAFTYKQYHWVLLPSRWNCDDYVSSPSDGDFWKVFVR